MLLPGCAATACCADCCSWGSIVLLKKRYVRYWLVRWVVGVGELKDVLRPSLCCCCYGCCSWGCSIACLPLNAPRKIFRLMLLLLFLAHKLC